VTATSLLGLFVLATVLREALESWLAALNRRYYRDPERQREAVRVLGVTGEDMARSLAYAEDRYRFARVSAWLRLAAGSAFLVAGGFGALERWARSGAARLGAGEIGTGLLFFGLAGLLGELLNVPFDYYETFRIEARHGFNRQTPRGFVVDRLKGIAVGAAIGGPLLAGILYFMTRSGALWWLYAWAAVSGFSVLTLWLYPRLLAPLFNRFAPLPDGELKEGIRALAARVGFRAGGVFVMDASRRSSHGNAYFTGVFREKRIVLFDTLLEVLSTRHVLAVLAHELGHFKLAHVRWQLVRGVALTGIMLYALSLCQGLTVFYRAFALQGPSAYGALLVFGSWFGVFDFMLQPLANAVSRRQELAADTFAVLHHGNASDLAEALLRMRERSHAMPVTHPLFSWMYHSHPPMLERLRALGYSGEDATKV
jgi:STE24 endopeptidase